MLRRGGTVRCPAVPLKPPYTTEGGHVPIYSMTNGRVSKRFWVFRNAAWCELCKEPVALWVNHHGRKDHALMDVHYTQLVEFPRTWDPQRILCSFIDLLGVPLERYHRKYSKYDFERRCEVRSMMTHLGVWTIRAPSYCIGIFLAHSCGSIPMAAFRTSQTLLISSRAPTIWKQCMMCADSSRLTD